LNWVVGDNVSGSYVFAA